MQFQLGRTGRVAGHLWTIGPSPPLPQRLPWEETVATLGAWLAPVIGTWFTPLVALVWLPFVIWGELVPRQRPWADLALLTCAVLCCLIWITGPHYALTWRGLTSNDRLFGGVIMLALSVVIIVYHALRRPLADPRICPACGYNLTGNTTGRCPECGRDLDQHAAATPSGR